jgi:hypothetical protein
MNLTPGSVYS